MVLQVLYQFILMKSSELLLLLAQLFPKGVPVVLRIWGVFLAGAIKYVWGSNIGILITALIACVRLRDETYDMLEDSLERSVANKRQEERPGEKIDPAEILNSPDLGLESLFEELLSILFGLGVGVLLCIVKVLLF
jgi:hypothetical protein